MDSTPRAPSANADFERGAVGLRHIGGPTRAGDLARTNMRWRRWRGSTRNNTRTNTRWRGSTRNNTRTNTRW
jgi:hypothetical protein